MFPLKEEKEDDSVTTFSWGVKKGKGAHNNDVQFYKSFTLDAIDYHLYDCVYMFRRDQVDPDIGKLVKVWETSTGKKKVKVVWFFRPCEITQWLHNIKVLDNELILASGEGIGLSNCNYLEAITGKCNVVCISADRRNRQPTDKELEAADFVFYRTIDVKTYKISNTFPNSISQIEVMNFFNEGTDQQQALHYGGKGSSEKLQSSPSSGGATTKTAGNGQSERNSLSERRKATISSHGQVKQDNIHMINGNVARTEVKHSRCISSTSLYDSRALKKRKLQHSLDSAPSEQPMIQSMDQKTKVIETGGQGRQGNTSVMDKTVARTNCSLSESCVLEKRKHRDPSGPSPGEQSIVEESAIQVTKEIRVKEVSSTWFKQKPWDERLRDAQKRGSLVLLANLDPSYTSTEVEEIVWHTLEQKVSAKMVQLNAYANSLNGKAFVIFKSSEAAQTAMSELKRRCLILDDGRPIVARRGSIEEFVKTSGFPGHLSIRKIKCQKQEEMRKAVSTSHQSQSNTIEHEMAIEWRVLQETSSLRWKALHQEHAAEMELLHSKLEATSQN